MCVRIPAHQRSGSGADTSTGVDTARAADPLVQQWLELLASLASCWTKGLSTPRASPFHSPLAGAMKASGFCCQPRPPLVLNRQREASAGDTAQPMKHLQARGPDIQSPLARSCRRMELESEAIHWTPGTTGNTGCPSSPESLALLSP